MKFYFICMKSDEVGTTLKHPETINGNIKNLSKRIEKKDKGNDNFYFKNLILPLLLLPRGRNEANGLFITLSLLHLAF